MQDKSTQAALIEDGIPVENPLEDDEDDFSNDDDENSHL